MISQPGGAGSFPDGVGRATDETNKIPVTMMLFIYVNISIAVDGHTLDRGHKSRIQQLGSESIPE